MKAQGLPLNFIVVAAITALVLILVIAFTVGGGAPFLCKVFKSDCSPKNYTWETVKVINSAELCDKTCRSLVGSTINQRVVGEMMDNSSIYSSCYCVVEERK